MREFNKMLSFWTLQGILRNIDYGVNAKSWKRIKIKLDHEHTMFIQYSELGPSSATLYLDNHDTFFMEDRIGITKPEPLEKVMKKIKYWMKDF